MGDRQSPRREFLHVDDLADACVFLMEHYDDDRHINVGTGEDLSIRELAELIRDVVHPSASIVFDAIEARWHAAKAPLSRTAARAWLDPQHRAAGRDEDGIKWFFANKDHARGMAPASA